jgi:hypothetical protein
VTQIFISYSRSERATAARLAERLSEAGHSVWWDVELVGGQQFEVEIQAALRAAKAVIVLWSKASVASDWVRAEAEVARVARTAVPVLIDDVSVDELPMVFRALHTVDLRKWNGDPAAAGFQDILGAVAKLGAVAGSPRSATGSHYPLPLQRRRSWMIYAALAAVVVLVLGGGLAWWLLRPVANSCEGNPVTITEVPLTLCLAAEWKPTNQNPYQYRSSTSAVEMRVVVGTSVLTPQAFRDAIVANAQRIAGDPAKIAIVRDGNLSVDGMQWRSIEFTNAGQAAFVIFYFSNSGFGNVQVMFVSSVADVAIRNELATPILKSINDTRS